jgi:hypothetical protein
VHPASTDNVGSSTDHYTPTDGFRGKTQFSQDEIEQFINGHTGDANITMDRPSMTNVHDALTKGTAQMIPGRNAEVWVYKNTKVVVNYDQPWRSSAWKLH